jgi:FKBP-type peptidyl-prolyl cis-trans isomerase
MVLQYIQCVAFNVTDTCEVTYAGTLRDGTPFDAGTTSFAPNQVIKGWTEAMQLMAEGDKWRLHIPFDLAYGSRYDIEINKLNFCIKIFAMSSDIRRCIIQLLLK